MNPDLRNRLLTEFGLTKEHIAKLADDGAREEGDLKLLTADDLQQHFGIPFVTARKIVNVFNPPVLVAPVVAPATAGPIDPNEEIPEGTAPSATQVQGFAADLGINPLMFMMFMNGSGGASDMDFTGLIPIQTMVDGYNPRIRNMYLTVLGKVEDRNGVPIIVINSDGSMNKPLTVEYITGLEEGREPAENNIYYDGESNPHEVIAVGVDAQSIHDADPIQPTKALQVNGMGTGRIQWNNVSLEVRQVAYYAVLTGEINPQDEGHTTWLRDNIKPGVNRLVLGGRAPKALTQFNEASRSGALPTLRVMLSRSPRRRENGPRRRTSSPRDLSGIGGPYPGDDKL